MFSVNIIFNAENVISRGKKKRRGGGGEGGRGGWGENFSRYIPYTIGVCPLSLIVIV
jgi:hypothetical protein